MNIFIKNNWFKIAILVIILSSFIFLSQSNVINAISGACSSHGGVNCSLGRQLNGNVICNDGWKDSIAEYDFMMMCQNQQFSCNAIEWNNLSKKYNLDELSFKIKDIVDKMAVISKDVADFSKSIDYTTFYSLQFQHDALKKQYDQAFTITERECFAIGADRVSQKNLERMQLEFYNNQIQTEQNKLKQIEEDRQKNEEWYQAELKKLDELAQQSACPINSILEGDKCRCITGYSVYNSQCIFNLDYCRLTYGN
ncbi:MAG: hypothetical protein WC349_05320, partial [Patescibacteria group bacterium]